MDKNVGLIFWKASSDEFQCMSLLRSPVTGPSVPSHIITQHEFQLAGGFKRLQLLACVQLFSKCRVQICVGSPTNLIILFRGFPQSVRPDNLGIHQLN